MSKVYLPVFADGTGGFITVTITTGNQSSTIQNPSGNGVSSHYSSSYNSVIFIELVSAIIIIAMSIFMRGKR